MMLFIYNEFFKSSTSDKGDNDYGFMLMLSILRALEKEEEHVLNFMFGHQALNRR